MGNTGKKSNSESAPPGSEHVYRLVFDRVNDGIIIHDSRGKIFDINKTMYTRLGYTRAEMSQMTLQDIVSSEYSGKIKSRLKKLQEEGVAVFESGDIRKDGTVMPVEISAREIEYKGHKAILSVVRDITQRKMAEEVITAALAERDILHKEIQSQSRRIIQAICIILEHNCRDFSSPFELMVERIRAYAHLFEKIYRYNNYTKIDLADFANWHLKLLFSQYKSGASQVRLQKDIQNIHLGIHQAAPCGLIIHELVSNSLRHAFPQGRTGKIVVQMQRLDPERYILAVEDNGKGLAPSFDLAAANTLGFQLVKEFSSQIDGNLELDTTSGTHFTIIFPIR